MKKLYKFNWDCGRMGDVDGIFIADEKDVKKIIGKEIWFGEILGKHSDVGGIIEKDEITELTSDQKFINKCVEIFGSLSLSGYNPLDYIEEQEWA